MERPIFILNGPNLNLLGRREPEIYGSETLDDIRDRCTARAATLARELNFRQSNFEGEIVESIHEACDAASAIIINPAGYSFTSIALLDALKMFDGPIVELHISNIHKRESYYHNSLISGVATGVIIGLGAHGYELAIDAVHQLLESKAGLR